MKKIIALLLSMMMVLSMAGTTNSATAFGTGSDSKTS